MQKRLIAPALLAALLAGSAVAQQLPPDCSKAAAPKQPLEVSVSGARFAPKSVTLRTSNSVTYGDQQFDTYRLSFKSEDKFSAPLESDVTVLVRKGQRVDGKVFRKLPTKDTDKQPAPTQGLPEVQGWTLKNRPAQADLSHVSYIGSLRLDFGQREGSAISGNIYLCVPKGQTTMFDKTPTREDSYAVGTFQAQIEEK